MSLSRRSNNLEERSAQFNAAKRTKVLLARIVDGMAPAIGADQPDIYEVSAPLTMPDTMTLKLATLVLRHYPEEVTSRLTPLPYEVRLSLNEEPSPPILTAAFTLRHDK